MSGYEYITGKAKWAKVQKPEKDLNGKEKYSIDVVVTKEQARELHEKGVKVKEDKDGDLFVKVKTNAFYPNGDPAPVPVVDANNRPMKDLIGNGSDVTVAYKPHEYAAFGGGVTLILCGVKVNSLVPYVESGGNPFGEPEPESDNPFV